MSDIEDHIDRLYQLPLDEFTAARNALAKEAKRPEIKALEKPHLAAWAVNQLYWQNRDVYDQLVEASTRLRGEHRKLLAGKSSDIRNAETAHREATRAAIEWVKQALAGGGHAATDQTLAAVQETLEALPSSEAPGRLLRPLKPMGFEALAGLSIAPGAKPGLRLVPKTSSAKAAGAKADRASAPKPEKAEASAKRARELAKQREQEEQERKARQREAAKALKAAEAAMLHAEEDVKKAEKTLAELRAARDQAVSEYQRARLRAHE